MLLEPRVLLRKMFDAAVASAQPETCLPAFLPPRPAGRTIVIGAGKASAAMAQAVERHWRGPLEGLVVTRYGYAQPCKHIEIIEAAHPVPDAASLTAAQRMLRTVHGLTADDLVICLVSGGASALLALPLEPLTLDELRVVNLALLRSGASINEMNCVRRHISAIKGGRLAAACHPAKLLNLLISDVPGDNPINIGSGPTVADPTTCADALDIIRRYELTLPAAAMRVLQEGVGESIKADDCRLAGNETHLVVTPQIALNAAAAVADAVGVPALILGDSVEGEARDVGKVMAAMALQVARHGQPHAAPCILLSGGETTVTIKGDGRGGRNVEFLLSLGIALDGCENVYALAGDTDGVDGQEEIAGAYLTPDSLSRAWNLGVNPKNALKNNDGHGFFQTLGDSIVTGPTYTNVNDFRAIFITDGK